MYGTEAYITWFFIRSSGRKPEDACRPEYRTERDGKVYCKIKLNLNKLVEEGKTEFAHPTPDPNLLTPEELKMFNEWYLKFTKYIESNKNTQEV